MAQRRKRPTSIPLIARPLVDENGCVTRAWYDFFVDQTSGPTPYEPITVGPSPFSYVAVHPGMALIVSGTVSATALVRGRIAISPTGRTAGFFPMSQNDQLIVTYTVAPVMWFIPNGNPA